MSDESGYYGAYKKHAIEISRDEFLGNYYIMVRSPSGTYCYDGYWRDSADKTMAEAIEEAKIGAGLKKRPIP